MEKDRGIILYLQRRIWPSSLCSIRRFVARRSDEAASVAVTVVLGLGDVILLVHGLAQAKDRCSTGHDCFLQRDPSPDAMLIPEHGKF
jgi:hypothetical protein